MESEALVKRKGTRARAAALVFAILGIGLFVWGMPTRNWLAILVGEALMLVGAGLSIWFLRHRRRMRQRDITSVTLDRVATNGWVSMDERIASNHRAAVVTAVVATVAAVGAVAAPLMFIAGQLQLELTAASVAVVIGLPLVAVGFWLWWTRSSLPVSRALTGMGARELPQDSPSQGVLQDLALAAGLASAPGVYVVDVQAANAFAVGADPSTGAIVVTSGLESILDRDELRAALAGTLAHLIGGLGLMQAIQPPQTWRHEEATRLAAELAADSDGLHLHREPSVHLAMLRRLASARVAMPEWLGARSVYRSAAVWPLVSLVDGPTAIPQRISQLNEMLRAQGWYWDESERSPTGVAGLANKGIERTASGSINQ